MSIILSVLFFLVGKVNGAINLLACGGDAGNEHHLVTFLVAHDGVVDVLYLVLVVDAHVVDVGDDKSVAYASLFKLAGLDAAHLNAVAYAQLLKSCFESLPCLIFGFFG